MPANNSPHLVNQGDRFERLVVTGFSHNDKRHRRHYSVRCDCGTVKTVQGTLLRTGNTKSCGCLAKEARAATRVPGNHSEVTAIILGYKRHAINRGYAWNLSRNDVVALISDNCHYCGAPPSNTKTHKNTIQPLVYSGIDRTDNTRGYEPGNVVPCCAICNVAKGTQSIVEFKAWVARISAFAAQWGTI